jgi:hypothetical protein
MKAHQGAGITPVEFHILLALVDTDRHGYAIMQQVAADSGDAIQLGPGTRLARGSTRCFSICTQSRFVASTAKRCCSCSTTNAAR